MIFKVNRKSAMLQARTMLDILCSEPGRTAIYYASVIGVRSDQTGAALAHLRQKMLCHSEKKQVVDSLDGKVGYKLTFYWPTETGRSALASLTEPPTNVVPLPGPESPARRRAYKASRWRALWALIRGEGLYIRREGEK